jgi:hypothetical protein
VSPRDLVVRAEWSARLADTANRLGEYATAASEWRIAAQLYEEAAAAAAEAGGPEAAARLAWAEEVCKDIKITAKMVAR